MASGDKLQIVLEARDEMTGEIAKARKSIRELEAEQKKYADAAESGNKEAAAAHEKVRKQILDQKAALEDLKAEQRVVSGEARRLATEEAKARVQAKAAAKSQADAMAGVARVTARTTGVIRVQASAWDTVKMKAGYAASSFKAKWSAAIASVESKLEGLQSKMGASGLVTGAGKVAKAGAVGAGVAGVGLGAVGLKTASQLEQSQIALEQMTGSAEKAQAMIDWLKETAAQTPFELSGLTMASQKLLAYGFSVKEAQKNLLVIGDAASATGLGQEGIDRVTTALGQMQAKQKISGEEMLQLTEAGIPAWEMLAEKVGKSVPELQAMVALPGGAAELFKNGGLTDLIDGMGEKYDGLMEKQSQTLGGLWSTLKDTVALASAEIVQKYMPQIKAFLTTLIEGAGKVGTVFSKVFDALKPVFSFIVDNKEIIGGMAIAFVALTAAVWLFNVAMGAMAAVLAINPITLVVLAVVALIGLLVLAYKKVDWFRAAVDAAFRWIKGAIAWFVDWFKTYAVPILKVYLKAWVFYLTKVVWPAIKFVFKVIAAVFKVFWAYVSKVWWPSVRAVFRALVGAGRWIIDGVKGAWQKVTTAFTNAKERIGNIVNGIKDFFKNLWSGLTEGLPAAIDTMKQWLGKIPGFGSILEGLLFTGGPVTAGGTYGVGELGPELFVPTFGKPFMIGESGPEVREFSQSGFVVPNHLLGATGATTMVRERVVEQVGRSAPLVGQMVVQSERDAMAELRRMDERARRLERERS